jgi:hypothetical protein
LESAAYRQICEHLQESRNAGSRPEAPFFNILETLCARVDVTPQTERRSSMRIVTHYLLAVVILTIYGGQV